MYLSIIPLANGNERIDASATFKNEVFGSFDGYLTYIQNKQGQLLVLFSGYHKPTKATDAECIDLNNTLRFSDSKI